MGSSWIKVTTPMVDEPVFMPSYHLGEDRTPRNKAQVGRWPAL